MSEFNIQNSKVEQLNDQGNNYKLVTQTGSNAVSEQGNVTQVDGHHNKVQVDRPKRSIWSALWKKIRSWWTGGTGS